MSGRLGGKIAIVTGATEGIGRAVAGAFAGEGARLVLVARREQPGVELAGELGADVASFVGGDVADPATADRAVETALERFGALDVLVNNAALDLSGVPLFDTTLERAREIFDVNVFGALAMQLACARVMAERGGGSIVNVTSRLGLVGLPGSAVYGASKGALHALTRGAAVEWARLGIRVNSVAPGLTETPMITAWVDAQAEPARVSPLARGVDPARALLHAGGGRRRGRLPRLGRGGVGHRRVGLGRRGLHGRLSGRSRVRRGHHAVLARWIFRARSGRIAGGARRGGAGGLRARRAFEHRARVDGRAVLQEERNVPLAAYTTTVVGAHGVPRWYEALDQQVEAQVLTRDDMRDAQWRASQAALLDQEVAGIDIVNGGEMHRRTNNRHSPPNAMLNYFWEKMPGFARDPDGGLVTRARALTPKDRNVFHPAAICTERIEYVDLGLLEEFGFVAKHARDSDRVKVTMTGPHALAKVAWDEHYGDLGQMMMDLAELINRNLRDLQAAGCKHIQLDEPLFSIAGTTRA